MATFMGLPSSRGHGSMRSAEGTTGWHPFIKKWQSSRGVPPLIVILAADGQRLFINPITNFRNTSMTTIDISTMTDEEIAAIVAEQRKRRMAKTKSAKYAAFEPSYSEYRKAVTEAKRATDLKKSLLKGLRALGFGAKKADVAGSAPKATSRKKK